MGTIRMGLSIPEMLNRPITPPESPKAKRHQPNHDLRAGFGPSRTALSATPISTISSPSVAQTPVNKTEDSADGNTVGEVAYPVHGQFDDETRRQLDRFCVASSERITQSACHVAFHSDKRNFLSKMGRNGFEVYAYTFRYSESTGAEPQDRSLSNDEERMVLWDYNIGLVRMANLFKWQTSFVKTMPKRALQRTPGLEGLSHNITGGKTDCQGFWIPFEAAKALAATFCWKIRYALTPIFGQDFVDLCVPPDDERFRDHTIDNAIIRRCNLQADRLMRLARSYQQEPMRGSRNASEMTLSPEQIPTSASPESPAQKRSPTQSIRLYSSKKRARDEAADKQEGRNVSRKTEFQPAHSPGPAKGRPKRQTAAKAKPLLLQRKVQKPAATNVVSRDEQQSMHDAAVALVEFSRQAHAERLEAMDL